MKHFKAIHAYLEVHYWAGVVAEENEAYCAMTVAVGRILLKEDVEASFEILVEASISLAILRGRRWGYDVSELGKLLDESAQRAMERASTPLPSFALENCCSTEEQYLNRMARATRKLHRAFSGLKREEDIVPAIIEIAEANDLLPIITQ